VTVVVRALAMASRSPTLRLAIAVATPTITRATTPASANRPTSNATKRRPAHEPPEADRSARLDSAALDRLTARA
jgi:hypothetical protein